MYKLPFGNIDRFLAVIDFCRNSALSFWPILDFSVCNSLAIVLCVLGGAISIVAAGNVLMYLLSLLMFKCLNCSCSNTTHQV